MIKLYDIYKEYSTKSNKTIVLNNCSYEFGNSGLYCIIGPSGCGKTTLLNLIAGFDKPTSGKIIFNDEEISNFSKEKLNMYYSNNISFVFQELNLIESLNVEENLITSLRLVGLKENKNKLNNILKSLGIDNLRKRKINQLSGGQKQRVAIARALLRDSDILLCDEPTGSLDSKNANIIFSELKKISEKKLVIVVSHNIELSKLYADEIITFQNNTLVTYYYLKDKNESTNNCFPKKQNNIICQQQKKITYKKELFKISLNYLFKKKFRFLLSLLFTFFSLLSFTLSSSFFTFSSNEAILYSMNLNDEKTITFKKQMECYYSKNNYSFKYVMDANCSENDIAYIEDKLNTNILSVYSYFQNDILPSKIESNIFTNMKISGFCEIDQNILRNYDFDLFGSLPIRNNEIVITKLMFEIYKTYGFLCNGKTYKIEKFDDIIGKEITLKPIEYYPKEFEFTITGIIDTNFNFEYYSQLLDNNIKHVTIENQLNALLTHNIHNAVFLKRDYYINNISSLHKNILTTDNMISLKNKDNIFIGMANGISCGVPSDYNTTIYLDDLQTELNDNDMLIPLSSLFVTASECRTYYLDKYCKSTYASIKEEFESQNPYANNYHDYENYLLMNDYTDLVFNNITKSDYTKMSIKNYLETKTNDNTINISLNYDALEADYALTVKGVYYSEDYDDTIVYVNNNFYNELVNILSYLTDDILFFVTPLYGDRNKDSSNIKIISQNNEPEIKYNIDGDKVLATSYQISNDYSYTYNLINTEQNFYKFILIIVGISSLVLSIIFLSIYITGTIEDRKREIGILKVLGIREHSLYLIFFYINLIFSFICSVSLSVVSPIIENIFNHYLCKEYSILCKYISLSILEYASIIFITLLLSFLGTLISIKTILKKPIISFLHKTK